VKYVIRFSISLEKINARNCKSKKSRHLPFSREKKDKRGWFIIYLLSPRKLENSVEIRDIDITRTDTVVV